MSRQCYDLLRAHTPLGLCRRYPGAGDNAAVLNVPVQPTVETATSNGQRVSASDIVDSIAH